MATVTTKITCPADVYTALSSASEPSVSFRVKSMEKTTIARVATAAAVPAATITDYVAISDRRWKEFGGLTSNVYFMPVGCPAVVEVMKG